MSSKRFQSQKLQTRKKTWFSQKNMKDRLSFYNKYKEWITEEWSKVMFTDETMVCQFDNFTAYIRRSPNRRYYPKYTVLLLPLRIHQKWWLVEEFHKMVGLRSDSFLKKQQWWLNVSPIAKEQMTSVHSNKKHHNIPTKWYSTPHK